MTSFERQRREFLAEHPEPGNDPVDRLRHVNAVFAEAGADKWAVTATTGMYDKGVTTGLTFGDLRKLLAHIDALTEDIDALTGEAR